MKCNDCRRETENLQKCLVKGWHCADRVNCVRIAFPETASRQKYQKRNKGGKRVFLKTGEWLYEENGITQILK